ncbi:hypothetical protein EH30_06325 [Erythrobacter sp. JL475]|nr:hypothetical protein EH30_06325 [Erythrobacter sp. JL475]
MIVFDLHCDSGHRFEAWFKSSSAFEDQSARGLVDCPHCGSSVIGKAPMAPAVPAKGNQRDQSPRVPAPQGEGMMAGGSIPPEVLKAMRALAEAQAKALKQSRYVGDKLADEARAMHYGDKDLEAIHGKATIKEAQELLDEGVPVAPLLAPFTPPDELN